MGCEQTMQKTIWVGTKKQCEEICFQPSGEKKRGCENNIWPKGYVFREIDTISKCFCDFIESDLPTPIYKSAWMTPPELTFLCRLDCDAQVLNDVKISVSGVDQAQAKLMIDIAKA